MNTQNPHDRRPHPVARRVGRRTRRRPCRTFDRRHERRMDAPRTRPHPQPANGRRARAHARHDVHGGAAAALRRHDRHELVGQFFRIIVAAPGSMTGKYPVGNTGGADVSAFRPMPIPDDLRAALEQEEPTATRA